MDSAEIVIVRKSFFESLTGIDLVFSHLIALTGVTGFFVSLIFTTSTCPARVIDETSPVQMLVCVGILQDRFRKRRRQLATIPRNDMPILRARDLSKVSAARMRQCCFVC